MKRLLEDSDASLSALTELVAAANKHEPNPFAKRVVQARIVRAAEAGGARRSFLKRPALLGLGALLVAATAAAAGYELLKAPQSLPVAPPASVVEPPRVQPRPVVVAPAPAEQTSEAPRTVLAPPSVKRLDKLAAGEDPTKVAEAVRALRKQGDAAKAQALLDQYLRSNPRGALAEDALALSIEAAAARKDPRAADYARRYLARYPNGRFRSVAERALSR